MCAEGALHWITAGVGRAETRGQASVLCADRRYAYIPDAPAAQWNELHAFAEFPEIAFKLSSLGQFLSRSHRDTERYGISNRHTSKSKFSEDCVWK